MNILGHSHFTFGHSHFNAQIGLELEHDLGIVLYTLAIGFAHGFFGGFPGISRLLCELCF